MRALLAVGVGLMVLAVGNLAWTLCMVATDALMQRLRTTHPSVQEWQGLLLGRAIGVVVVAWVLGHLTIAWLRSR